MHQSLKASLFLLVLSLSSAVVAQSYDKLWKQVEQHQEAGKPQSAYAVTQSILRKAIAEKKTGQQLSARLMGASLRQEWAPDSFFTDIVELEALRAQASQPEVRAIYASLLAEVYANNRTRSQARGLELTSSEMREWTREQYDSAAVRNWQLSLENIDVLASARSKDWLPFVAMGSHSAYFHHDLLHILWQRFRDYPTSSWNHSEPNLKTLGSAVRDSYQRQGNREAELLVALDLTETAARPLIELKGQYAQLPLCTEVYLRLLDTDTTDAQKVAWCEEAISRYPRYDRIGEVKNRLNGLRSPMASWKGSEVYYPGKTYSWLLTSKNTNTLTMTIYRLKDVFSDEDVEKSKLTVAEYLRRHGTEVQNISCPIEQKEPFVTTEDTLEWKAPGVGLYAVLYSATTSEKDVKQRRVNDQYHIFRVTTLKTITRVLPEEMLEVVVVDAESGQPVEGATVALYESQKRTDQRVLRGSYRTDSEGRVLCQPNINARSQMTLKVFKAGDMYLPEEELWFRNTSFLDDKDNVQLRLYTDRAIYRPGQTVHLSGIVFSQKHWDASVLKGKEYELRLLDANWKEVGRQKVATDSLGVMAADFILPEGGLPGNYRIQSDGATVLFCVEEYKRPTFEVTMDETPALQWPQDSMTLTGTAMGYNGVPVREARVTGHYQFTYPYRWWYRHMDSPRESIDTVTTDDRGVFRVRVPLRDIPAESLRHGLVLCLNVEILSPAGETREGSTRVPLCTTPLRLNITMQDKQDRDRLVSPSFSLLTSTGKPASGEISCDIYSVASASEAVVSGVTPEGLLETLRTLPSGDYELLASAKAGTDTASAKASFYLFSMADTRLLRRAESWLYCPNDTFDLQHPARIQIGSSFEDVALYYSLVGKEGVIKNELISLSDELRVMEIPYLPAYGDGVNIHFAFVKGGQCYKMNKALKVTMPDKQLRWQWTTFRDRLHPGDKETWTLRITAPDGKPAGANLMATLYDASLDQLKPHVWDLLVNRTHRLRSLPWRSNDFFRQHSTHDYLFFPMKDYRADALAFDAFDDKWLNGISFHAYGPRRVFVRGRAGAKAMSAEAASADGNVYYTLAEVPLAKAQLDKDQALNGRIAGLSLSTEDSEEELAGAAVAEDERIGAASAIVRTDFSETAFFMPRLHSNPTTGEVTLAFTLPESLTTWQLLGIAHTPDMMTTTLQAQAIAHKEMMARLYLPRFMRAGDASSLRAVVQNLTDASLSGKVRLEVFDPETEKVILRKQASFEAKAKGESVLTFDYTPSEDFPIVAVRLTAESPQFADGEQQYLPILASKEWMTESIEIQADAPGTFTTDLASLFNHDHTSATQRRLTVEYTTHPIWNVVQALPALREPQHDDVLSASSVLYANVLAAHIAATTPRLKTIIGLWKQQGNAAKSPLATNEDVKQMILEETPWLREADSDSKRRAMLMDLFNENLLHSRIDGTLQKLAKRQEADGGFAWFPGMRSSELMTRLVCIDLTHLRALTNNFAQLPAETVEQLNSLIRRAVKYVAAANAKQVQEMKNAEAKGADVNTGHLMYLHYVYISQRAGVSLTKSQQADVRYLLDHLKGSVAGMDNEERAMAAIVLAHDGRRQESRLYFDAMKEYLTTTAKQGAFFDYAGGSFTPTGHKILIHTAAMEAARELQPDDHALNSALRRWLLRQKRTQMWESSICTANAIYALLYGAEATAELQSTATDKLTLNYAHRKVKVQGNTSSPAAIGYLRETYTDGEAPTAITVERCNAGEAWGAVYAQYLTPIADATAHAEGLAIRRQMSNQYPQVGERITTRYVITADRDYEYVCLRADRAACMEPAEQRSGYRYQGGLGYYRAVRNARTEYFFDRLPKGTYVLEETAFADRSGAYTTGLCTLRCLYAPEYGANTAHLIMEVK